MYTKEELQKKLTPFYFLDTMYDEGLAMIEREDNRINTHTLFVPEKIIAVYDLYHQKQYVAGKDFRHIPGTNIIERLEGSEIPYYHKNALQGKNEHGVPFSEKEADELGRKNYANVFLGVGDYWWNPQISITYTHKGVWSGYRCPYQGHRLSKLRQKLQQGKPLTVMFLGDSIFAGCNASSMYNREPNLPFFAQLVCDTLHEKFGSEIRLVNPSRGGQPSAWGAEIAQELVKTESPDLLVTGFGTNDLGNPGVNIAANMKKIIDTFRQACPDCEYILVSAIHPNKDSTWYSTQYETSSEFAKLAEDGVAFVDIFKMIEDILQYKDYAATSGNNINHPNDWLVTVYAQMILSAILDLEKE